MGETLCLNKTYIVMLLVALIIIGVYQYHKIGEITSGVCQPCQQCPKCPAIEKTVETTVEKPQINNIVVDNSPPVDPIKEYDYRKAFDPLEDPTRRPDVGFLPPIHVKRVIDFPTRGMPDNYQQLGILVKEGDGDNKILRLFGRRQFPGSNRFDYYTALNMGNDQIKVPLEVKKELYDDDTVTVSELGNEYTVKIHKYDSPRYYPDILW